MASQVKGVKSDAIKVDVSLGCNALLIGIQQFLLAKLQGLQNSAARVVSRARKYEHITPVLIKLHWLPVKFRIQFKVLLLVYNIEHSMNGNGAT